MTTLLSEIHFWTVQEDVLVKNTDYGSFKYFLKKDVKESVYDQAKKQYCETNGILYVLNHKRPPKLRDRLKELEEHLVHNKIVCYSWDENKLKLLLSTGLIVQLILNSKTGDLTCINFEKQLSAKLQVNIICDGILLGSQVICICNDGHVLGLGGPWKDGWVLEGGPRRHLNYHGEWLAVWGKAEVEHPQPWSPLAKDHQRANLHLYWIGCRDPELLTYKKTDGDPLLVIISKYSSKTIILVEQKVTQNGAVSVEVVDFELVGNVLKRLSVTSVPLQTQVSCSSLSADENRLLIGCIDGSLALLDKNRGSTRTIKCSFIPTMASWQPEGVFVAVVNERGLLQYYDTALSCIKSQLSSEDCTPTTLLDFSGYFNTQFSIVSINWGPIGLVVSLEQGPLAMLTFVEPSMNVKAVAQRYLSCGKIEKAIKLLLSWNFDDKAFFVLQKVVAYLMKQPLTMEIAQHLQNALGSFHSPPLPLSYRIQHKFGHQVFSLTRRFFHQLVRANMFETAFLLAVDIGHHDLFMDLHYIAVRIGETEMAAAARAQASALLSRCSSKASNCSRSSCSQCSDSKCTYSSSDEESPHHHQLTANPSNTKPEDFQMSQPPDILNSENILTTNFNEPVPTTYQAVKIGTHERRRGTSSEKVLLTNLSSVSSSNRLETDIQESRNVSETPSFRFAPKATYVEAPQVPPSFSKLSSVTPSVVPPLPFHSALGIPYIQQYAETVTNQSKMTSSSNLNMSEENMNQSNAFLSYNINNMCLSNICKPSNLPPIPGSISKLVPPPLPAITTSISLQSNFEPFYSYSQEDQERFSISTSFVNSNPFANLNQLVHPSDGYLTDNNLDFPTSSVNTSTLSKKNQPKVKFSDTVTAFIVPEIKRPVRPPPPPHVTDPQRELAESLPLCHPNEDYLKDFTPVRTDEIQTNENKRPSKIKVVHFGVV